MVFQNLFPARGRKLRSIQERKIRMIMQFFRTYSPQGDGNLSGLSLKSFLFRLCFSEPIPRKGTETVMCFLLGGVVLNGWFFRTYSPQGDGNIIGLNQKAMGIRIVFQNLFPARGRKPVKRGRPRTPITITAFFRTYSPQGDGNLKAFFTYLNYL